MSMLKAFLTVATVCLFAFAAQAEEIEIQLVDVDIEYDSSTGVIQAEGGEDDLSGLFFFFDGNPLGSLVGDDLSLKLTIPGISGIDPNGSAHQTTDGFLELLTPDSVIQLDLDDQIDVAYTPFDNGFSSFQFVFVGAVGSIVTQDLPFDLKLEDPVTVTLSTQVSELVQTDREVTEFKASGTGELKAKNDTDPDGEVPEPTAIVLLGMAAATTLTRSRR